MKKRHWAMAAAGLILVSLSIWQVSAAAQGLEITTLRSTDPPLTLIAPADGSTAGRPMILIGHGFAGSAAIMRGFAYTLAHAGYAVVLWDFDGHGANARPLAGLDGGPLLSNADNALAAATARGFGDPRRVAIVGHSMGSGVALTIGQVHPDTSATIAVSPVNQTVGPELPHNLLLMAGSLEPQFLRTAEQLLAEAGGPGGNPAAGTGRKLVAVLGVEHISILFSPTAHAAAREWLDATFGPQPSAQAYTDRRVWWYIVGVIGALLLGAGLARLVATLPGESQVRRSLWRRLVSLIGGALGATLLLWLVTLSGLTLSASLGLLVGGYLLIWFGLAGLFSLLLLRPRFYLPSRRQMLSGLMAFAVLWLGVGLLGQTVWLPWLLIPKRLLLWPLGTLLLFPWFLAVGETVAGADALARIGWWLAHSLIVAGCLFLALQLTADLFFLILILPLFPIILGLHAAASAPHRGSWPFALSGALFTSWLLLAVFPLG